MVPACGQVPGIGEFIYLYRLVGHLFHLAGARAGYIGYVVVAVSVIDEYSIVNDLGVAVRAIPVAVIITGIHILRRNEHPPVVRACIVAIGRGEFVTGPKRRPAIKSISITPAYPCRPPVVAGDPKPAIIVVVGPAAIVEAGPAPWII